MEIKELGDGKTKETWNTQTTWGDHTVKGLNQILPRLLKIFPKAKRTRDSSGRNCLEGIGFIPPNDGSSGGGDPGGGGQPPNSPKGNSVSQCNNSERLLNGSEGGLNHLKPNSSKNSEATEANTTISRVKNLWAVLSEEERSQFLQELGVENNSRENSSNQLQDVHNPVTVSDAAPSVHVQTVSEHIQKLSLPTVQALANQILLCQTWAAVALAVNRDGGKLKKVASVGMSQEQRSCLTTLLAAHLCENPADLNQLAWVPGKLRDRALFASHFHHSASGGRCKCSRCLLRNYIRLQVCLSRAYWNSQSKVGVPGKRGEPTACVWRGCNRGYCQRCPCKRVRHAEELPCI